MKSAKAVNLQLIPKARLDVINVNNQLAERLGDLLSKYGKAVYYSYQTTAGYFNQSFCAQLKRGCDSIRAHVQSFQKPSSPNADYRCESKCREHANFFFRRTLPF